MRILITGSEGVVGNVVVKTLEKDNHDLVLLDKRAEESVDLLKDRLEDYFKDIETVLHFAAYPRAWISKEQAHENFSMTWNVLEVCKKADVKRFIYASSLNVYDFEKIYLEGKRIDSSTPLFPHTKNNWSGGQKGGKFYGISKILSEKLAEHYYHLFGMSVLNLRLGGIYEENKPHDNESFEYATWLSHEDFSEILRRAIHFKGLESVACASANSEDFVDLKYLKKVLGYEPQSDSSRFKKD